MARLARLIVGGCVLLGCGGGGGGPAGEPLDCAWLEGSDNCWRTFLATVQTCAPPAGGEGGTLSADRASCTYANGPVVTFTPPTVYPLPDSWLWEFSIAYGGQPCLHHKELGDNNDFDLTVMGQTFKQRAVGLMGVSFTCADGSVFSTSNALNLFSCPNGLAGLPITGHSVSSTAASFSFGDGATSVEAFSCAQ